MESVIDESRYNSAYAPIEINTRVIDLNNKCSKDLLAALKRADLHGAIKIVTHADVYREEVENNPGEIFYLDKPSSEGTIENTPLILACGLNAVELVNVMIDKGASLNIANRYGHNPLTWAATCGHPEVVRLLLFKGVYINHQTLEGRTALHCACMYLKGRVVNAILKFLYEKFLMYRISKHQSTKYDSDRWTRYAIMLENFLNVSVCYLIGDGMFDGGVMGYR